MFYRSAIRPLLFSLDPEQAHERTLGLLEVANSAPLRVGGKAFANAALTVSLAGLTFPNPIGLAAGCDKNGRAASLWSRFGFGFVEVGTVTAQPQAGNPKPRVFRLPQQEALINRLGFNSEGAEAVARRLAALRRRPRAMAVPLGINIGKTKKVTGDEATLDDYRVSFRRLSRLADFMVVNVSSPNTPGLRQWQERGKLEALLGALVEEQKALARLRESRPVPIFVKVSPDMEESDLCDTADVALELGLAGIVATNTTLAREGALAGMEQQGGLSGKPLRERACRTLRLLYRHTEGRIPLIGVGGISSAEDAYARIKAGAALVQLYTALVYEGPFLPRQINQGLLRLMARDGVKQVSELVGTEA